MAHAAVVQEIQSREQSVPPTVGYRLTVVFVHIRNDYRPWNATLAAMFALGADNLQTASVLLSLQDLCRSNDQQLIDDITLGRWASHDIVELYDLCSRAVADKSPVAGHCPSV